MTIPTISAQSVFELLGTAASPLLLDVRDDNQILASGRTPVGAIRFPHYFVLQNVLPSRQLVLFDTHELSSSEPAERLAEDGYQTTVLEGGYEEWQANGLPTRNVCPIESNIWVTRERPKIDRIACPWLIHRFIKPWPMPYGGNFAMAIDQESRSCKWIWSFYLIAN